MNYVLFQTADKKPF